MKLSHLKQVLQNVEQVQFQLPNGEFVPPHFHVTEVGQITKRFVDCGGSLREDQVVNFQLWTAEDYDHRLSAEKLRHIIDLSEKALGLEDGEIEVEYQGETIGKYHLEWNGSHFQLTNTHTDCLAKDQCGIPTEKTKVRLSELSPSSGACTPGGGCC